MLRSTLVTAPPFLRNGQLMGCPPPHISCPLFRALLEFGECVWGGNFYFFLPLLARKRFWPFFNIRLAILNLFQQLLEDIAVANVTLLSVCSLVVRDALVGGRWSNGISFMVLNLGTQNVLCLGGMWWWHFGLWILATNGFDDSAWSGCRISSWERLGQRLKKIRKFTKKINADRSRSFMNKLWKRSPGIRTKSLPMTWEVEDFLIESGSLTIFMWSKISKGLMDEWMNGGGCGWTSLSVLSVCLD